MRASVRCLVIAAALLPGLASSMHLHWERPAELRISVGDDGEQANGQSYGGAISSDGRYAVFASDASNLVPADTNGRRDVFLRDLLLDSTELVSIDSYGRPMVGHSYEPDVSDDGRFVAFSSTAPYVGPSVGEGRGIFVRDRSGGTTLQVDAVLAASPPASRRPSISANGDYVVFDSPSPWPAATDTNAVRDVFFWDQRYAQLTRVSADPNRAEPNGDSFGAQVSRDGSVVAFLTNATNWGAQHGAPAVYLWSPVQPASAFGSVPLVSVGRVAAEQPLALSGNGKTLAVSMLIGGGDECRDGLCAHFPPTRRIALLDLGGATSKPPILVGAAVNASSGSGEGSPQLNTDGSAVAFQSTATNLGSDGYPGEHVFVWDRSRNLTIWMDVDLSRPPDVVPPCSDSARSRLHGISGDGLKALFTSSEGYIVPNDSNGLEDVFLANATDAAGDWRVRMDPCGNPPGSGAPGPRGPGPQAPHDQPDGAEPRVGGPKGFVAEVQRAPGLWFGVLVLGATTAIVLAFGAQALRKR